jgi:hypothetical protein
VPESGPPGLTRRGLETGSRRTYTGTKPETADTAKGSLRGTAPVPDPTTQWVGTKLDRIIQLLELIAALHVAGL